MGSTDHGGMQCFSEGASGEILEAIAVRPGITIPELSELTSVTERSIQRNLSGLQAESRLQRIGPAKVECWRVVD